MEYSDPVIGWLRIAASSRVEYPAHATRRRDSLSQIVAQLLVTMGYETREPHYAARAHLVEVLDWLVYITP